MSKQTESLKLALEALEDISSHYMSLPKKGCMALAAIEEALADSALDRMAENARELGLDYEPPCKTGSQCTSKCQQCDEPAQEPVAWIVWNGWRKESVFFTYEGAEEFRAASQRHDDLSGNLAAYRVAPLYTSPPASKPWVGLTEDEVLDMARTFGAQPWPPGSCATFGQMIEAKLKEKNT